MRRISAGDAQLEELFRREFASLVRALTALAGDRQAAADAVQDAFIQAHRHWRRVSTLGSPAGWVRHAALNRLRNQERGRRRGTAALARLGTPADAVPAADAARLDLPPALAALPDQQRASIVLYYLLDQTTTDIAATLGIAEATVRSHLRHGRERLAHLLGEAAV